MSRGQHLIIRRVWRSQIGKLALFLISSPLCVWLSEIFPGSVLNGPLFSFSDYRITLDLPVFWFIPAFFAFSAIINVYDVRYLLDTQGLEAKIGILSLNQTTIKLRFEDIRSIDARQTLLDRILGIGAVDIGTAASAGLEMSMIGVSDPLNLQRIIQTERDSVNNRRLKKQDVSRASGE